jgi:hypothetical protein
VLHHKGRGNLCDPKHLWLLDRGLFDIGREVREACVWALGRLGTIQTRGFLEKFLSNPDQRVIDTVYLEL